MLKSLSRCLLACLAGALLAACGGAITAPEARVPAAPARTETPLKTPEAPPPATGGVGASQTCSVTLPVLPGQPLICTLFGGSQIGTES